ncbi:outer membrane protein assembly factor BamC [Kaarinaea lacus]
MVIIKRIALWYGFFLVILVINACGINQEKRENAYRQAQTAPKLQVPEDLQLPIERRSLMDVPEELDTGEIPKDLELPPVLAGIDLEMEPEKTEVASEDEEDVPVQQKKTLKSEIIFKSDDNTQMLIVKSDIDTVWPRVAKAITSIGFTIDDSNRGKFYYSISREFERLQTIQDPSKPVEMDFDTPKEEHLIYVEPGEAHTEITVRNAKSEIEGTVLANQILQQIKNYVEEP